MAEPLHTAGRTRAPRTPTRVLLLAGAIITVLLGGLFMARPAAASVTAVPRSLASSVSPAIAGVLLSTALPGLPLVICGGLKIAYDISLLLMFRNVKPPEERGVRTEPSATAAGGRSVSGADP